MIIHDSSHASIMINNICIYIYIYIYIIMICIMINNANDNIIITMIIRRLRAPAQRPTEGPPGMGAPPGSVPARRAAVIIMYQLSLAHVNDS